MLHTVVSLFKPHTFVFFIKKPVKNQLATLVVNELGNIVHNLSVIYKLYDPSFISQRATSLINRGQFRSVISSHAIVVCENDKIVCPLGCG